MAAGSSVTYTLSGGHWRARIVPGDPGFEALSCSTPTFCLAIGTYAYIFRNGVVVGKHDLQDSEIDEVSCGRGNYCVLPAGDGPPTVYANGKWRQAPYSAPAYDLQGGVSCASASFCGGFGDGFDIFNGRTWKVADRNVSWNVGNWALSCGAATLCMLIDSSGNAHRWDGTKVQRAVNVSGSHALVAVSCAGASFCAALDEDGNAYTWQNGTWSGPVVVPFADGANPFDVSCAAAGHCVAVDDQDNAYTLGS